MVIKKESIDMHRAYNIIKNIKQFSDEIKYNMDNDLYDDDELNAIWQNLRDAEDKLFKAAKIL